ncbi:hypothetical protein MOQ72_29070 [Saccharopolyspora sp. K220]|uniref:hypothetical protein n=1 Tax=Saccharopolyspora soli TaxID=2926618 RepID=UPI001F586689|nr:hypothetical protein [Saccharopolyspora soli]MCI2421493.1 hypothetical protein [Saccharopolyspora soli]
MSVEAMTIALFVGSVVLLCVSVYLAWRTRRVYKEAREVMRQAEDVLTTTEKDLERVKQVHTDQQFWEIAAREDMP